MQWGIAYYESADGAVPGADFLDACPRNVEAKILAVLNAVRAAPPPAFSGGGMWEAMHGDMGGYYEIRVTGPGRRQYRLFCRLDNGTEEELAERGFDVPQVVAINGLVKPVGVLFRDRDYKTHVRDLGDRYLRLTPRPVAK